MARLCAALVLLMAGTSCTSVGWVSDGTSLSYGSSNRGALVDGIELPVAGDGYFMPPTWAGRGLNWGTEELVGLLVRASRRVRAESPESTLHIADLSPRRGGASTWHRSHQTGRDADLLFFGIDAEGRQAPAPLAMIRYDDAGMGAVVDEARNPVSPRTFDVARNWLLVRALLEDPIVEVQFLFISNALKKKLLEHAAGMGEPTAILAEAEMILSQPGDSLPHDDHLHVRIYCPPSDRSLGCRDRGPQRWLKKGWKYVDRMTKVAAVPTPGFMMCRMMGVSLLAARW